VTWALAVALVTAACSTSRPQSGERPDAASHAAAQLEDAGFVSAAAELTAAIVDAGNGPRPLSDATLRKTIDIPAGRFASGSTPGDDGRDTSVEPALAPVDLRDFSIDVLPYPDDPSAAPQLASSEGEAAAACASRGARLCTELEWERGCKGPNNDAFATGSVWNDACDRAPSKCASGFGARAMGFMPEWTDSRFTPEPGASPVLRGGPAGGHRCAARIHAHASPNAKKNAGHGGQAAFRCCHGDRNDATIAPIEARPAFRTTTMSADELARILSETPALTRISEGVRLFSEENVKMILERSGASPVGITFTTSPIVWSPAVGVELLVATGRAKKTGFIVALWTVPSSAGSGPSYRFASSFLLLNDASPIALAYEPSRRKELRWTTCWGCTGGQGGVIVRDDGRVVVVQY
jgi:hypothetical protein